MPPLEEHPLRHELNAEVHARPPVPLQCPEAVSYLALLHDAGSSNEAAHIKLLAAQLGLAEPDTDTGHVSLDAGEFRLKWERHNEFSAYTFFRHAEAGDVTDEHALLSVPTVWRNNIPGQLLVATHIAIHAAGPNSPEDAITTARSTGTSTVAAQIAGGGGWVVTDFQIRDGYSRFLILNASLTPRQAGRTVQRLLEIETYRIMALLAFPVAKQVRELLSRAEGELASLMDDMGRTASPNDERAVLDRLTLLAAEVEQSVATTTFRFGAAAAYYQLVRQRIADLRETRIPGFPTIEEFMERRLTPAINTCATMARRQEDLSGRIARNSQLLRTRVDIELERQNQQLLTQMNHRVKLQLHLQRTVEGLSIVAITYYGSQLVHYLAKGAKEMLVPLTPEHITAIAIPVIAGLVHLGLRRTRSLLESHET
jgi:uncharacterized membrane-anchored protein